MTIRFFIPQSVIDAWVSFDRVDLQGEVITVKPSGVRLRLAPAAHFKTAVGDSDDMYDLIGKVKDQDAIDQMGGQALMTSVMIGDAAYDVDPGFVAMAADETDGGGLLHVMRTMGA